MGLTRRRFLTATAALTTTGAVPRWSRAATPLPDVIVIGAGLAGLAAALTLQQAAARALVLESQRRVGGKVLSFDRIPGCPEAMARALRAAVRLGARAAICALPFSVVRDRRFDPVLSGVQAEAIKTLPHQQATQIALAARTFGQLDDAGEVMSVLVTACGNKATALDRMGRDAAVARVIREFEDLRPASRGRLAPAAWHSWGLDLHAAGDWAVFAPGTVTRFLPAMLEPHGRVHFCGEQTALANRGMEGAMESGERAALEALEHL